MSRKGRDFELAYKWLYELDSNKYKVTSPAYIYDKAQGSTREVDVLIEYKDDNNCLRRIMVECRKRKQRDNVQWIEQLKTKKEDLELDYIIVTTTNKFTKGAINKARYHGIIIEEAEYLDKETIDNVSKEIFVDLMFLKFEVQELNFFMGDRGIVSLNKIINNSSIFEQNELLNFLNKDYYFSIDPHKIMEQNNFDREKFFEYTENSFIMQTVDVVFDERSPKIIKNLGIQRMYISIKMIPYKLSLPLNKSLSLFEVDPKKNKKYSARFGNDEENLIVGYLEDGKVIHKLNLKNRPLHRFVFADLHLNTIFPKGMETNEINMDEIIEKAIGKFDLNRVLNNKNIKK